MSKLEYLRTNLRRGQVYRRADLERWSSAVDRHLKELLEDGTLLKLSGGLYHHPKETDFGTVPPTDEVLVKAFLKDNRFLLTSPNAYNALGVGTTQLYNETVVYNHKRHGRFELGGRVFDFRRKPHLPKKLTQEFLLVDLVNNLRQLAEDENAVLANVAQKAESLNRERFKKAVRDYAKVRTKKFFAPVLEQGTLSYGT